MTLCDVELFCTSLPLYIGSVTPAQVPAIQILMWNADMHFSPDGTYMTLDECAAQRTEAWKALGQDIDMSDVVNFLKTYGKCTE